MKKGSLTMRTLASALFLAVTSLSAADPSLVNLVMPDAKVLAGMDVERAKTTPFGQYVLTTFAQEDGKLARFIEATGFDPRRDIREILVAATGTDRSALLRVKGRFDPVRLQQVLERLGGLKTEHQGVTLVMSKRGNEALAILDEETVIGGHPDAVRAAVDRRSQGSILSPALAVKVNQLSTSQDAWVVADDVSQLTKAVNTEGPIDAEAIRKVQQASAGVKFGATVQVTAEAVAETTQDASALADVARLLAQIALMRNKNPEAAAVLRSLNVTASERTVNLTVSIPQEQMERIFRPHRRPARVRPAALRR
jgi:hypothetical protein